MRIFVVPDLQIRPNTDLSYIDQYARYIVDKRPDVLVVIGDWADMESLSSYDKGKKSFEGRTYRNDILAANDGLQRLMAPIDAEIKRRVESHKPRWNLRKVVTLGNHEHRINRAIETQRELEGLISTDDLFFKQWGFEVYPFLEPVVIEDIAFAHYFCSGAMGLPVQTARAMLTKKHMSCIAGHRQGYDVATDYRGDGRRITAIICGSGYPEDQPYLNAQTNRHYRGGLMLNEVKDGEYDEMKVSLKYLKERYGKA